MKTTKLTLDQLRSVRAILKVGHASPVHPGTGSPQKVHGGKGGTGKKRPDISGKAPQYASYILRHKTGNTLPKDLEEFDKDFRMPDEYETYGDWARAVVKEYTIAATIENSEGILSEKDRPKLEKISELSDGLSAPYKVVIEKKAKTGSDLNPESMGEWGYSTSEYGIRPAGLQAVAWWDAPDGPEDSWTIHIVDNDQLTREEMFWHEFGHTLPDHVIDKTVGKLKPGEVRGDRMDRFAKKMSKK